MNSIDNETGIVTLDSPDEMFLVKSKALHFAMRIEEKKNRAQDFDMPSLLSTAEILEKYLKNGEIPPSSINLL